MRKAHTKVVIGIQARSTSKRFPGKVFAQLGGRPVLQHMIDTARETCAYINQFRNRNNISASFCVLIPERDLIKKEFGNSVDIVEGPEDDVLARYQMMAFAKAPDYIVRLTADCPLIPSYLVTKHIRTAVENGYDYLSNVFEGIRTQLDGFDVEVFSRKLLLEASTRAKEPSDREHVTTWMRRETPDWARVGHVVGFLHLADLKLSIDTMEDLERVRRYYQTIQDAIKKAEETHGKGSVHRF